MGGRPNLRHLGVRHRSARSTTRSQTGARRVEVGPNAEAAETSVIAPHLARRCRWNALTAVIRGMRTYENGERSEDRSPPVTGGGGVLGKPGSVPKVAPPQLSLLERERSDVVVDIVFGDERAVEQLLLARCAGLAGLDERVGFVDRLLRVDGDRLQHGVLQFARLDRRDGVRRAVEAADLDAAPAFRPLSAPRSRRAPSRRCR